MKDKRLEQQLQDSLNRTLSGVRTTSFQREQFFENATGGRKVKRKLTYSLSLALIIALMLATMGVAFALTNGFGILDFARTQWEDVEVPPDAEKYIDHDLAISETEHFTVRFRETAYDGKSCHVVYDVVPKSKDILLFEGIEDEFWYGLTHLNPDREKMLQDGRTILDVWNAGSYAEAWEVDIDVYDPNDTEFIREYGGGGVLDEETGVYTGHIDVPFSSVKTKRNLTFSVRMLPRIDMRDEFAVDYERAEYGYLTQSFHAAVSGEEKVLASTEPMLIPSIGVRIAKSAILRAHELPEGALDHCRVVTNLYVTNQRPDYRRWFIQFQVLKEGSDSYVERFYTCVVDQEGQVIRDPDIDEPTLEEKAAAAMALRQKELESSNGTKQERRPPKRTKEKPSAEEAVPRVVPWRKPLPRKKLIS